MTFTVGYLLGQHVTQLLLAEANLVDGLSSVLEGDVIAVEVRGKKYFCISSSVSGVREKPGTLGERTGIPVEALARGEVCDLETVSEEAGKQKLQKRTRRGGPSGSPMLMTVDCSLESAEPVKVLANSNYPSTKMKHSKKERYCRK